MKLVDLLNKANTGYEDGFLSQFYDETTGELKHGTGDGLAEFIVVEIAETYDPKASDEDQLGEAIRVMDKAASDVQSVIAALERR